MVHKQALLLAGLCSLGAVASPCKPESSLPAPPFDNGACPPVNGSRVLDVYQLYPENADWDTKQCLLYMSVLYNSSVAVYDPYKNEVVETITLPGLTLNPLLHASGVAVDPYTGLVTIVANAGAAFDTQGLDISGPNFVVKWDPVAKRELWRVNLTEAVTAGQWGGFQDVETDARGNTYVVGTFPTSIVRIDAAGTKVETWYLAPGGPPFSNFTFSSFGGLANAGNDVLLANDVTSGEIYRLDMTAAAGAAQPVLVPRTPAGLPPMAQTDAIHMPPMFGGRVLLVASNFEGAHVLRSKDGSWTEAEYLGLISNNVTEAMGAWITAAVQIGSDSIYALEEFFTDPKVDGLAGNRTQFPLVDITDKVAALLEK